MTTVVAALIEREGKLLICRRRRDAVFPLKWEFPGGKVQANETLRDALTRELREELGVSVSGGREAYRTRHRYPETASELELVFFSTQLDKGVTPRNLVFEALAWVPRQALTDYDFLAADLPLVRKLAALEL